MKAEYDLSKGIRGKFYRKGASLRLPVYLDEVSKKIVEQIAEQVEQDVSTIVNEIIHRIRKDGKISA